MNLCAEELPELIVIAGPTASGKSALALETAQRENGEIVSVDSMQIYRGLEIGTAQPDAEAKKAVKHHLTGIYSFMTPVDVYKYTALAEQAVRDIANRGKLPVLAGGTGLYLRALLYGIDDLPADRALRSELDAAYDSDAGFPDLCARMAELDPAGLDKWRNCRRRLIRALEVRLLTGKSLLELQKMNYSRPRCRFRLIKLDPPADELRARIRERAEKMLAGGWIEEAEAAIKAGLLESPTAHQAIGYRLIDAFLRGEFSRDELLERICAATRQYARRQRTWFRHQKP